MEKTGQRIKELRIELGLSQAQLAALVGAAQNTIAQYEKGSTKIGLEILVNLAIALKTTTDYLLGLDKYNY